MSDNKQFDRSKCFTFFNTYRIQGKRIREKYGDKMAADYYEAIIDYGLDQKPIIDDELMLLIGETLLETIDSSQKRRSRGFGENTERTKAIIELVRDNPGISQSKVASAVHCSKSTVSAALKNFREGKYKEVFDFNIIIGGTEYKPDGSTVTDESESEYENVPESSTDGQYGTGTNTNYNTNNNINSTERYQYHSVGSRNTVTVNMDADASDASLDISDYAKAVEDYNNAIADGDNSKISEASQKFSELDSTVNGLVKNTGMSAYADQVKEVRDELNDTAIANDKFTKAVNGTDTSKFGKAVSDNAKALKELNLSDTDFRYAFETDGVQEGEDQINALVQAALDTGVISDTSASSVANLASMLAELGVISSSTGSSLDEVAESIGDISERIDKASAALTGIQKAESVLDAQSTGKSISLDDFNSDELADYTSALEYNNGALQLNAEKVRELQKAKAEEQIQTNNNQKAEKQN